MTKHFSLFFNTLDFWVPVAPAVLRDPANHRRRAQHRDPQRSDPQRGVRSGRVRAPLPQQCAVCVGVPGLASAGVGELNYFPCIHSPHCEMLSLKFLGHLTLFFFLVGM